MLTKREFFGEEFYAWCQQEYDKARFFLKRCGKPSDDYDRWMIDFHRTTSQIFGKFLKETSG